MVRTVRHFWPDLSRWLQELPDTRFQPRIPYDRRFLAWWGLALFVFKLGSRRQLDSDLRDLSTQILPNLNRLAGTELESLPVDGTLDHFLGPMGGSPLAGFRTRMIRPLIRIASPPIRNISRVPDGISGFLRKSWIV